MQITIHNPNNLPTIDYRDVNPLQGNLKDLTDTNYAKLKGVLEKRGFRAPLFLWTDSEEFYLMDGHQRQIVMTQEDMNDNGNYEVPYVLIEAANKQEAEAQLLEITSQYGKITHEGFDEYIAKAELPEPEVLEAVHYDALPLLDQEREEKAKKKQLLTCPECQFEAEMKDFKRRKRYAAFKNNNELPDNWEELTPAVEKFSGEAVDG